MLLEQKQLSLRKLRTGKRIFWKIYYRKNNQQNKYVKNGTETYLNFKLAGNIRNRAQHAFNFQNVKKKRTKLLIY